ncbi:annexin-B12-like [Zootermopsis nevadensis]|uniref:annexin-B12-like n=1 Tax=Zootermopsis nevadensis TaxID=136037 RepID=UPI000B8EC113|nr:annexin-B12-like [Zootermopsis nevadensis]
MMTNFGRLLHVPADFRKKASQSPKSAASVNSNFTSSTKGTIRPNPNLNAELAARQLNAAFQGIKSDAVTIINILTTHSNHQRQKIKRHYKILYVKELESDIISDLGGHFRDVALALLQTPQEFVADNIHMTLQKIRPEESIMVELLCGRSNSRIMLIKESYYKKYGRDLDIAVKRQMNSDLSRLMRILLTTEREEAEVNVAQAHKEAQMLAHAGVGMRYGTDDAVIAELLLRRSYPHLREMFAEFHTIKRHPIEDSIRLDFRGGLRDGLLALVKAVNNPVEFFTDQIRAAFRDPEPNDYQLIRLFVARSELDLADIKDHYVEMHDSKLGSTVTEETRGDYRRILLRLLGY